MESPWLSRLWRVCRLACCARPLPGSVFRAGRWLPNVTDPKRHARKAADGAQCVEVCWAASAPGKAPRKPERNLGPESACGRESEEEEREMGRKGEREEDGQAAGGGDGWRRDWAFKREVNPTQRPGPGHLGGLGSWGSPGVDVGGKWAEFGGFGGFEAGGGRSALLLLVCGAELRMDAEDARGAARGGTGVPARRGHVWVDATAPTAPS